MMEKKKAKSPVEKLVTNVLGQDNSLEVMGGIQVTNKDSNMGAKEGVRELIFSSDEMKDTESHKDGLTSRQVALERRRGSIGIIQMMYQLNGRKKGYKKVTVQHQLTATYLFHQFVTVHSLKVFNCYDVAAACLYFVCKLENGYQSAAEVTKVWLKVKLNTKEDFDRYTDNFQGAIHLLLFIENMIIQTIGLNFPNCIPILPNYLIERCGKYLELEKDVVAAANYFASNMIIMLDWVVRLQPKTIAIVALQLALNFKYKSPNLDKRYNYSHFSDELFRCPEDCVKSMVFVNGHKKQKMTDALCTSYLKEVEAIDSSEIAFLDVIETFNGDRRKLIAEKERSEKERLVSQLMGATASKPRLVGNFDPTNQSHENSQNHHKLEKDTQKRESSAFFQPPHKYPRIEAPSPIKQTSG